MKRYARLQRIMPRDFLILSKNINDILLEVEVVFRMKISVGGTDFVGVFQRFYAIMKLNKRLYFDMSGRKESG